MVPVIECVLKALTGEQIQTSKQYITEIVNERERLFELLRNLTLVERVWTSHANFLLVQFENIGIVERCLRKHKILIRTFSDEADLKNCARITIGTRAENDALLAALSDMEEIRR